MSSDVQRIQRHMGSGDKSRLLQSLIRAGHPYRLTKAGIIIHGPNGITGTHLSDSGRRGIDNFKSDLRRVGIELPRKHGKGGAS